MFAWSHTTYARWHGMIFNFEWKRDLDYFLAHAKDAVRIYAVEAYAEMFNNNVEFVKVEASCRFGSDNDRRKRVNQWYNQQKLTTKGEKKDGQKNVRS